MKKLLTPAILALFTLLTLILLYPLSLNLTTMVPEPTDPVLNAWRLQWNARAFLSGPNAIANIADTNIFYPYPLTLVYSEHFILLAAQALPFLVLADSHLLGVNLSVVLSFILSGYAMYLLVTAWTGRRWAGVIAGILFAFSPYRFGQINHLELLITQWMPLTLLALHWTLTRPGLRYMLILLIFMNLQALSGFHFFFNLVIASVLMTVIYALAGLIHWRRGLWVAGAVSVVITFALNWPIWSLYLQFSDLMGAVRTPGEVRIYSAAMTDYLTTIPYHWLYGWTFSYEPWQLANHQTQPLMPVGVIGLSLALVGLMWSFPRRSVGRARGRGNARPPLQGGIETQTTQSPIPAITFSLLLTLIGIILSFGLNEQALGNGLAAWLAYSPYQWLYENVIVFQAIRVPARFGMLAVLALPILGGVGVAWLSQYTQPQYSQGTMTVWVYLLIIGLITVESWSNLSVANPPTFAAGDAGIPAVYPWLRDNSSPETVILKLPHDDSSEFLYEYYSSHHWRRMANGSTGYTPPIYKELRQWFNRFPDPKSVDVIQQLGIDLIILHSDSYSPDEWQRVQNDLPRYLPAIQHIQQIDAAWVIQLKRDDDLLCPPHSDLVGVTLQPNMGLDGLANTISVIYHNWGQTAFVADVNQVSQLLFPDPKNFAEPLITPAGESQTVIVPIENTTVLEGARLATLQRTVGLEDKRRPDLTGFPNLSGLELDYSGGAKLLGYSSDQPQPTPCQRVQIALKWQNLNGSDLPIVELLDPFGRLVAEANNVGVMESRSYHSLPLVGTLPPGEYGIRIRLRQADGGEHWPQTEDGTPIPPDQVPPLPLVIHQNPTLYERLSLAEKIASWSGTVHLLNAQVEAEGLAAGGWLHLQLAWQTPEPLPLELTVFSQLLGPDGQVWGQQDNQPGGGWYRTPFWPADQPIVDHYAFPLQPGAPSGDYQLIVGLYDSATGQRLPVDGGGDFVVVGTVRVE